MHIGLVARCLNTDHIRGMGRYVFELLRQSAGESALQWSVFGNDPSHPLAVPVGLNLSTDTFSFRGDRFHLWEQLGLPLRVRRRVDLLHCTEGALPWWQPVPTVVTLHDTVEWHAPSGSRVSRLYFDTLLPAALARSAAVITISESSRRDILTLWPALEPKLTVIPHGIADEYLEENPHTERGELQLQLGARPYLVYLGGPAPRKRFDWAVRVLEAAGLPDLHLVACGFAAEAREKARASIPTKLSTRVHFAPFLSDAHLLSLYRGAGAVLYPTLYEGFGFPAIEAQAAGAPAIFSAVSSLSELVGPLAMVVEPQDLSGWAAAVRRALALAERRATLASQARAWAQRFSWRRSFEAHCNVYRRVLIGRANN